MHLRKTKNKDALTTVELLFFVGYALFLLAWMVSKPYNSAPDEAARYPLVEYIYQHGQLPLGDEASIQIPQWGFSYAYYPFFLGPLLSALFMKIAGVFTSDPFVLFSAARFTSALAAVVAVYFVMKLSRRLFGRPYHWIMTAMVAFIPQFLFLGSYINNDIISVCGAVIILCAWVCGLQDGWNGKNSVLLAAGIIVTALSYYNAYGWILCSMILYLSSWLLQQKKEPGWQKNMWKYGAVISAVVLTGISYFFIRNAILYHGDFLGMRTLTAAGEQNAADFLKPSLRATPKNQGLGLLSWLPHWARMSCMSFVGVFGWLDVFCPDVFYWYYGLFALLGAGLFACWLFSVFHKPKKPLEVLLLVCLLACGVMPLLLSLYYSYGVDYQPQGRYIYPMLPALAVLMTQGAVWLLKKWKSLRLQEWLIGGFCTMQALVAGMIFHFVFI